MRRKSWVTLTLCLMIGFFAMPVLAQEHGGEAGAGSYEHWSWLTAGFAMAIGSAFCGLGQGKAIAAACEGIARNPAAAGAIRITMIIGLALIESLALYVLVVIFAKV